MKKLPVSKLDEIKYRKMCKICKNVYSEFLYIFNNND